MEKQGIKPNILREEERKEIEKKLSRLQTQKHNGEEVKAPEFFEKMKEDFIQ